MDKVAKATGKTRADIFRETASKMSLHAAIVEKDFWVCWLLKQLFTVQEFEGWLVFKGGTSLSKCFSLIQRFSEDIDIAIDFEKLGFVGDKDPRREGLSHSKRQPLLDSMMGECQRYIGGSFLNALKRRIQEVLGLDGWTLDLKPTDHNVVEFAYPLALGERLDYISEKVVLELGTHAEPIPHDKYPIRPFAAQSFPGVFAEPACSVTAVVARRTFWEKATILHAEYHRPLSKPLLARYSRHYVDVAVMAQAPVADEALADLGLLKAVTIHKDRFYHCGWAKYPEAKPGSFKLLPRQERLQNLQLDYNAMASMFLGEPPTWEVVMGNLARLEERINR